MILLLLCAIATVFGPPPDRSASPEQVIKDQYGADAHILAVRRGPMDLVGCIRYCFLDTDSPSAVVLYTLRGEEEGFPDSINYELVGQVAGGWLGVLGGGMFGGGDSEQPDSLVAIHTTAIPEASPSFRFGVKRSNALLLYGRTLSPDVAMVEVQLDTRQTLRADVAGGVFAVIADAQGVCEIRLLDENSRPLQRIDRSANPLLDDCTA